MNPQWQEKRAEPRLPTRFECSLTLVMMPEIQGIGPLRGTSVNMTLYGVMIMIPGVAAAHVAEWNRAIQEDRRIEAQVRLQTPYDDLLLRGQLVWGLSLEETGIGAVAYAGILFHVLDDEENQRLRRVLAKIEEQTDT